MNIHSFNLGRSGAGGVDEAGGLNFVHEDVSPKSNTMGVGISHYYNSEQSIKNSEQAKGQAKGRGFDIMLSPKYDAENESDFYNNKVMVTKDSNGNITQITDRQNPDNKIILHHETITGKKRLKYIEDTNGRQTNFEYSGDLLVQITYPDNERTVLTYNGSDRLRHIVSPSKHGIYMTYSNNKVAKISNIAFFDSITAEGITPDTQLTYLSLPTPIEDNIINFTYDGNKTIKTGTDENIKTEYTFTDEGTSGLSENITIKEKVFVGSSEKSSATYSTTRMIQAKTISENADYNFYIGNQIQKINTVKSYDSQDRLIREQSIKKINNVVNGKTNNYKNIGVNRKITYDGKKLMSGTTTFEEYEDDTRMSAIEQKKHIITYSGHDENDKPTKLSL